MRVHYVLDQGLAHPMQTGVGQDTVASLQNAIKVLVKSKEVMACQATEIEVYALGIGKTDYQEATPLNPEETLPSGSTKSNPIFVHVPHEKQVLAPQERKLLSSNKAKSHAKKELPKSNGPKNPVKASYQAGHDLTDQEKIQTPKFMCYYKLGDTTPYYIETQGWEKTVGRLKERILETRGKRGTAPDLWGVTDITQFQIYPPGRDSSGQPIHPELDDYDALIPTNSSFEDPILVPAVRNREQDDKAKSVIQDIVKARMEKKRKSKLARKNSKENPKPIAVQVKTPDGTLIPVEMLPSDTIVSVKEKVASQVGVEVPNQVLHYKGTKLANEKTAKDLGLKDGSVLNLQPNAITVQVQTPEGKNIPVVIQPDDTIESIKEKVAPKAGMEVPQQIMKFMDKQLPNRETAVNMGLEDGSVIHLEPKPITVQVRTPDGTLIPVEMKPTHTIQFIKEAVAPETGMEVPNQVMTFNDAVLPNNDTANDMGLQDGSVIDLAPAEPKPITVKVKTLDGTIIPVTMKPSDTIQFIKEAVAPEAGMEVPQQVLKYKDKELQDGETADDMGLRDGSVVELQPKPITVQVRTPHGKMIPITIKPSDTVESIKEKVAPEAGIEVLQQILKFMDKELPDAETADGVGLKDGSVIDLEPKPITVKVRTPDGNLIPVTMKPSDPIQSIKEAVAPETGIEVPQQILKFMDKALPDGESADAVGLKDGSIVDLEPKPITVHVRTPNGKLTPVTMKPSDPIQTIKEAVATETGIEVPQQILNFEGKELPDGETANAVGLKDGSIIDLEPKCLTVHVKTSDGKSISVQIKPSDTIESIKEAVAPEAGIEVPQQVLTFEGKQLPNPKTAADMGLTDGSVIDLSPKPITVKVKCPNGKIIPVEIQPTNSILSIKESVAPESGIDVPQQQLSFEGEDLLDEETADALGLQDGDVIDLKPKGINIEVRCPDGKTISVQMQPSDTIQSIKEAVATAAGVEVPKQILKFEDKELPNEETAEAMGLKDGSVVDLMAQATPEEDAEAKYKEKKAKKEKKEKKKKKKKDKDWDPDKPKQYSHEFTSNPMDLTRHKAHFMVGDQVPMVLICSVHLTIFDFKVEVLKMKDSGSAIVARYFAGIDDPNRLKVFAAGSWGEGDPLPDDILVPRNSSPHAMFSVMK